MPKRIQQSRAKGWRKPVGAVYVGRPGPWGNPFVIGKDGSAAECVERYKRLLAGRICTTCEADIAEQKRVLQHASENMDALRGKDLMCWCRKDAPCHADVLLLLANR